MYESKLDLRETLDAIKFLKDTFETDLSIELKLTRVSAPLFVYKKTGLNDNLSGVEKAVTFKSKCCNDSDIEIVHSLAKWKRFSLDKYKFRYPEGLYTDMNAIRKDEDIDDIHSIYVDQWDWEKIILPEERNVDFLKSIVKKIVHSLYLTQEKLLRVYPTLDRYVHDDCYFITTEDLRKMYPDLTSKERENEITRLHKVVFIIGIGWPLKDGKSHDLRSPDYDDWNLNGDLLIYSPILDKAVEISSMGIRVDDPSLIKQLEYTNNLGRLKYDYHKKILQNELPLTIGGGIGQSRICLLLLNKMHIAEVQASLWPSELEDQLTKKGIDIL